MVESLLAQVAEAAKNLAEQAFEDFKKLSEFARLLKQQHLKLVSENVKLYCGRGWLNVEKFQTDREADKAATRVSQEKQAVK